MRKAAISFACLASFAAAKAITVTNPYVIFFENGSTRFTPLAKQVLDNSIAASRNLPTDRIEIQGGADRAGPADHNRRLSCARAKAVRHYLVAHGMPADRLVLVGWGEERPLFETPDGIADQRNRYVLIDFIPSGTGRSRPEAHC